MDAAPHLHCDRRGFLATAACAAAALCLARPAPAPAADEGPQAQALPRQRAAEPVPDPAMLERLYAPFADERLLYDLTMLRYIRAAEAELSLQRGPAEHQITGRLSAKARGFLGWLVNYREERFVSVMEAGVDPYSGRERLIPMQFERYSIVGEQELHSRHTFEYGARRVWSYKIYENGKLKRGRQATIPPGVIYEDLVSLVYNFRAGAFGALTPDRELSIKTIPYKGVDSYGLRLATADELAAEGRWLERAPGAAQMLIVTINRRIFGIEAGRARVLASAELLPVAAAIKDAIAFGNVEARLLNNPFRKQG